MKHFHSDNMSDKENIRDRESVKLKNDSQNMNYNDVNNNDLGMKKKCELDLVPDKYSRFLADECDSSGDQLLDQTVCDSESLDSEIPDNIKKETEDVYQKKTKYDTQDYKPAFSKFKYNTTLTSQTSSVAGLYDSDSTKDGLMTPSPQDIKFSKENFQTQVPQLRFTPSNLRFVRRILEDFYDKLCFFDEISFYLDQLPQISRKLKIPDEAALDFHEKISLAHDIITRFYTAPCISDNPIGEIERDLMQEGKYVQTWQFISTVVEFSMFSAHSQPSSRRSSLIRNRSLSPQRVSAVRVFGRLNKNRNPLLEKQDKLKAEAAPEDKNKVEGLDEEESKKFVEDISARVMSLAESDELCFLIRDLEEYNFEVNLKNYTDMSAFRAFAFEIKIKLSVFETKYKDSGKLNEDTRYKIMSQKKFWAKFESQIGKMADEFVGLPTKLKERFS